ncbi:protein of unknown function - conserved [Leishmania donovani]|uniref:Uncharacterized protein n=3 Tax=Leishmania donovani species complex TaxID=38574 RepID=A4IC29_LEIIN|nr:conserved hypothetical protein [Leishmania infantum JPCM5]CAC9547328.1 hypothetical_protein_-_conserved [Leishmania infantum]CAJ1993310.1 protein of unknown function - conserved [Leishmania donovani]CAM72404.1 conserved hypothetical protein [Leishmania infantum JPCM5]SUZ46322.1 hypothetical_protein_-_conserved [Leishmania infantum]VDZ49136.1 hypothetical_protein_conserved [Leishmania donovani]|eukprot:XP_001469298.1 conserved hypothetical protein [Leishmania infantum JPCM5]
MLDYLIPIGMALAGIFVMMFIFQSISKSEVGGESIAPARKPRSKRSQRPSQKYTEDVLDLATEQLIAREVARNPSGMITDSKRVAPQTLDNIRSRRQAREEGEHAQPHAKASERQKQSAKDQGFKVVESPKNMPRQQQQHEDKQQRESEQVTSIEELDRKLSLFFKSSSSRKAKDVKPREEVQIDSGINRGHVVVKGDLSKAKSW